MFFRFGSALLLVVIISLLGIAIEKQNLEMRRELSRQHYQMDVLLDEHAKLRFRTQELAAVEGLFDSVEGHDVDLKRPPRRSTLPKREKPIDGAPHPAPQEETHRSPLLFFQRAPIDLRLEAPHS